jgi:4-alpha-glucanotransferase
MQHNDKKRRKARPASATHRFQLVAPRVSKDYEVRILGSDPSLGEWDETQAVKLDDINYPVFSLDIKLKNPLEKVAYKYVIYDQAKQEIATWETGDNRICLPPSIEEESTFVVTTDEQFKYPVGNWKAAGVAIPVFSLRSESGLGVGEFNDLIPFIDWGKKTGMKLIQILPINDTTAKHAWTDSYPYSAISVFALHPLYLNIEKVGEFEEKALQKEYKKTRKALNALPQIDYDAVMEAKWKFIHALYNQQKEALTKDKTYKKFLKEQAEWLNPYAAFCALRDRYKTVDYTQWEAFAGYDAEAIAAHFSPKGEHYDEVGIHYFVQYHLFNQMQEVADYAREAGVVLKGDIPIGIFRTSVDSWIEPHLYYMGSQAGAPPDAFAEKGQNWGFPTYNWQAMAEDNYSWWRKRLSSMARFFDAYRIDHILGFFRIWEIPIAHTEGLMGHFNPDLPISADEIQNWVGWFDYDRFCRPYIREHILQERFGEYVDEVKWNLLTEIRPGQYILREEVDTQQKVEAKFAVSEDESPEIKAKVQRISGGLQSLIGEVLFFEVPFSNGTSFRPRISMHQTTSYKELDPGTRNQLDQLYTHYFYKRHEDFWREQAMVKLPAITQATDMLVCGEDLGMVPDCVPGVMDELGILSLEIQRMPKRPGSEFGHPADAPYLSVVSPGSHDMATLRGWWEEDHALSQRFYNDILGHEGSAPYFAEPWICKEIINQHMYSPAMWAIFPIQDLIAMDSELRNPDTHGERINVPANPKHYWRYRFHMSTKELLKAKSFNQMLEDMVNRSGRKADY